VAFAAHGRPLPGDIAELRSGEDALLAELWRRGEPLLALFIDYGPAELAYGDSLQAVCRHAFIDPLADPGNCDLTAHVQFAAFAAKARALGFACDGPISQGEFFGRLGMAERAQRLMAARPAEANQIEAGVQRLLTPTGMGGQFKVLLVRSPQLPSPEPFA
jgi:SAM-dependent MidA family methyltransferase